MRVLVFGDSITQGFWDTEGGWVERLRKYYDQYYTLTTCSQSSIGRTQIDRRQSWLVEQVL